MNTIIKPLPPADRPTIEMMRANALQQKGKFVGKLARQPFDDMKAAIPFAPGVTFERDTVGGVDGWWCRPAAPRADGEILYLHGGAYVLGTAKAFRGLASYFAYLTDMNTFVADYRLAPEHAFPAAPVDAMAAYYGMCMKTNASICVVGDSAGGALALGLLEALVQNGDTSTMPFAAAVMSPWTDLALLGESMHDRATADPIFTRDVMAAFAEEYLQGHDAMDPRASPLYGKLKELPPLRIDVGDDEILLDDARRYAQRAVAEGADITLAIWEGMPHSFQAGIAKLEAAKASVKEAADFLVQKLNAVKWA